MVARPLPSCDVGCAATPHRASPAGDAGPVPGARRAAGAHPTDRRLLVVKPWLKYSIVRLGLFAVVLGLLLTCVPSGPTVLGWVALGVVAGAA